MCSSVLQRIHASKGYGPVVDRVRALTFFIDRRHISILQIGGKVPESSNFWKRCFRIGDSGVERFFRMIGLIWSEYFPLSSMSSW